MACSIIGGTASMIAFLYSALIIAWIPRASPFEKAANPCFLAETSSDAKAVIKLSGMVKS
jgi:hypothetical protein